MSASTGGASVGDTRFVAYPEITDREARIAVSGELNRANAPALLDALAGTLRHRPDVVVLDLGRLSGMDTAGAAAVAAAAALVATSGGVLAVCEPPSFVRDLLDLGGLGALVVNCDDPDDDAPWVPGP